MSDYNAVISNGLRLEVPGIGAVSWMGGGSPHAKEPFTLEHHSYSEVANGLNISSGAWCNCNFNGMTLAIVGQFAILVRGVSLAGGWNVIDWQDGISIAILINSSYYLNGMQFGAINFAAEGKGVQVGIINRTKKMKGFQIGLFNINDQRALPIINWNFRD